MLGTLATVVVACFCLGSTPMPEPVPIAPDAPVVRDAIPPACVTAEWTKAHRILECPRLPLTDPFMPIGKRPLLLYRIH